jgi:predicted CXXCH cytochrome family protein
MYSPRRLLAFLLLVFVPAFVQGARTGAQSKTAAADSNGYLGNQACAACHASIYDSYSRTSMAHASGAAVDNLAPADFVHQKSGVHFRIYAENGKAWLAFERPNGPTVRGTRELLYSIGSGRRGRSYLFATDGFLFESPVNWYTDRHVWDMAPAYGDATHIPMNLPAYSSCLHCHVSEMQPPIQGTENRYPLPAFSHAGVTCERCHGPGATHVNGGAIVNPAKLDAQRRDAVCMQCHLEGKAAIERPARHVYDFRPGQELSDYIRYFVFDDQRPGLGAVSQFEALAQSQCKKKSGDAMSCTSCHDPHSEPSSAQRASYFRERCLACHGVKFGATHAADKPDCTACHMPSSLSTDVAHTEVTDHRIPRRPAISAHLLEDATTQSDLPRLVPFPDAQKKEETVRDLALAWESLVNSGMTAAAPQTERLLSTALEQSPNDPTLLSALGFAAQKKGDLDRARDLYAKALAIDSTLIDAATNLGAIEANRGDVREALRLWQDAFQRAPWQSSIGMNLARLLCATGKRDSARDSVLRVLEFNPDLLEAKSFMQHLSGSTANCENDSRERKN